MSDAVNFHFIYPQQPPRTINNHLRKQQPASKLINSYLSTAAQYLNRTKSFHVPQSIPFPTNTSIPIVNNNPQQVLLTDNPNLVQSVPSNMNNLNPPMSYQEHRFESVSSTVNNKSEGIVNVLRRSFRKNKAKFYNKRSTTMKSCNSLNHYEQSTIVQRQTSMTPNLICRHQYLENKTDLSTTKNNPSPSSVNEETEKNDRMRKRENLITNLFFSYRRNPSS